MMRLGSDTPLRVTGTAFIKKQHHEIRTRVSKSHSICSFSDCGACHATAYRDIFEEDDFLILNRPLSLLFLAFFYFIP
jgi:hypothetical protein